jgi:hypothetical protein
MKTPTVVRWGLVVAAASSCFAAFAWDETPAKSPAEGKPISVASLENQLPVGHLGVPLGTVVRVTGEAFSGDTTRRKADMGKTLLRIDKVNGKLLAKPVVFAFLRAPASVKKPIPGEKVDYYAHEYGEFDGVVTPPKELGIEQVVFAHDGFYYRRHLSVHASNAVPK